MVLHFRNEFMFFYFIIHDEISDKANEHHPYYTSHEASGYFSILIHRYEYPFISLNFRFKYPNIR